jgi:hypothetical protein
MYPASVEAGKRNSHLGNGTPKSSKAVFARDNVIMRQVRLDMRTIWRVKLGVIHGR